MDDKYGIHHGYTAWDPLNYVVWKGHFPSQGTFEDDYYYILLSFSQEGICKFPRGYRPQVVRRVANR